MAVESSVKFMDRNPPAFPEALARDVAARVFGVDGELAELVSERDQNFRVRGAAGEHVLKISNAAEDPGVVDLQTQALLHIEERDPDLPVPRIRPTREGEMTHWVEGPAGSQHMVRMVSYLPGTLLADAEKPAALIRDVGAALARLDMALRSFFHPHARNPHPWDITRASALAAHAPHIEDPALRRHAEEIFAHFTDSFEARLRGLRHQVIHNDATVDNLVVSPRDPRRLGGILDFGDLVFAPLICELGLATDTLLRVADPLETAAEIALGFDTVLRLEEEEIDLLYDVICTRLAVTATIIAWRHVVTPDRPPYLLEHREPLARELEQLRSIGRERFRDHLRRALRFPVYCPVGAAGGSEATDLGELLPRRHAVLGKSLALFYERPLHIERGAGALLYDANGRAFVDAYNNVPSVGHCHPHVERAIARQAAALATNTRYVYANIIEYAERLGETMSGDLTACIFVNSGSEANDVAWRIATFLTGRRGGIVLEHAYHGITEAIAALSPHKPAELAPHVKTLLSPDPYRGPYPATDPDCAAKYAADADRAIAELADGGFGTACFMVDTSFCSNGIPDVPAGYLPAVAEKVHAAGGLIVADEVQYGFARPGTHMWGYQHHRLAPDIVTLGKPVGGGFPLGVVVTTPDILAAFGRATGLFSTFGGNPVACAAGLAVLDVIEREGLMAKAATTGAYLREGLGTLMQKYEAIGDVRGHGLLAGVEIVADRESKTPAPTLMKRAMNRMRELGVLVGSEGAHGNVFKIRPPLAFGPEHADRLVEAMDQAFSELL